jgi:hypothetical protein
MSDPLGLGRAADAAGKVVERLLDGAGAFLGRICLPAAEEFGLMARDHVRHFRVVNAARLALKAKEKLDAMLPSGETAKAHPRVAGAILEEGSWVDDEEMQEMWAGLLASSCTEDGRDDENLFYVNILRQMTGSQARLMNHACEHAEKHANGPHLITASTLVIPFDEAKRITGTRDIGRLSREYSALQALNLFEGGHEFGVVSDMPGVSIEMVPSRVALAMYVRCQGSRQPIAEYFESTSKGPARAD